MSSVTSPLNVQATYDRVAESYDQSRKGHRLLLYDLLTDHQIDSILPSSPGHVLDAGAGTGRYAARVAKGGHRVTLMEPSIMMLTKARLRFEENGLMERAAFVQASLDSMPFQDATFDVVVCEGDPLSYCITTYQTAAREILRVTRPGGRFYVSCDSKWQAAMMLVCYGRLEAANECIREGLAYDPYGLRVRAFSASDLRETFQGAGAADVAVSGKVVLANLLSDEGFGRLVEAAGLDTLMRYEQALGAADSVMGLAGHLVVTGCKP